MSLFVSIFYDQGSGAATQGLSYSLTRWESCNYVSSQYLADVAPYNFTGELMGDKAHTVVFDNTKLKRAVPGFTATITPEAGIARTLDYCLSHKECQTEDPEFDAWCDKVIETLEQSKKAFR